MAKKISLFLRHPITRVVLIFLFWTTVIHIIVWWGDVKISDASNSSQIRVEGNRIFSAWAQWDSVYYHDLSNSYKSGAFFPLFPWLIKVVSFVVGNFSLLAATLVSNLFALGSCIVLYLLARLDNNKNTAYRSVFYLLIFPSSFFLVAHYTESVFLFFSLLSFYFFQKKKNVFAGIAGGVACWARTTGIFIYPALALGSLIKSIKPLKLEWRWKEQLSLAIIPLSTALFLLYNKIVFGKPFDFLQAQSGFGRYIEPNVFKTVYSHCLVQFVPRKIMTEDAANAFNYLMFFVLFVVFTYLVVKYSKSISYSVYALLTAIIPIFSGTFISMNRFLLVLFPIYLILPKLIKEGSTADKLYSFASTSFMVLIMILFTNSYWVG
ncbi:MAG TPA: glycosyltransferase family 39 protein [bacterium]|nr:glycosyltransferase family 39 protein [bacterium]